MNLVILVPRRPDHGWRDQLWAHARQPLLELDWPIVEGTDTRTLPFNRAQALNRAAELADPWEVAVILDADILVPPEQLQLAAKRAHLTGHLTFAYERRRNLNRQATNRLLHGWPITIDPSPAPNPHVQTDLPLWPASASCSSAFAVTRDLFETVGGFDERFVGWGWEDVAFHRSCSTLGGPAFAVTGDLLHLWHPRPQQRIEKDAQFVANQTLGERYKAAHGDIEAINALIAERAEDEHTETNAMTGEVT